jgi:hypothetical protein
MSVHDLLLYGLFSVGTDFVVFVSGATAARQKRNKAIVHVRNFNAPPRGCGATLAHNFDSDRPPTTI